MTITASAASATVRHCLRCGRADSEIEFPTATALKCVECEVKTKQFRKAYHRAYHAARAQAIRRLVRAHADEFKGYLDEEVERTHPHQAASESMAETG